MELERLAKTSATNSLQKVEADMLDFSHAVNVHKKLTHNKDLLSHMAPGIFAFLFLLLSLLLFSLVVCCFYITLLFYLFALSW